MICLLNRLLTSLIGIRVSVTVDLRLASLRLSLCLSHSFSLAAVKRGRASVDAPPDRFCFFPSPAPLLCTLSPPWTFSFFSFFTIFLFLSSCATRRVFLSSSHRLYVCFWVISRRVINPRNLTPSYRFPPINRPPDRQLLPDLWSLSFLSLFWGP